MTRDGLVVSKNMGRYSNGTSEYEELFEGGIQTVYKERLFGIGGFPFLVSLLILLSSKASYDFETTPNPVLICFLENKLQTLLSCL